MAKPAYLVKAEAGEASFFLQMGGQGSPWYKELKKLYDSGELKEFFEATLGAIEEEVPALAGSVSLPQGFEPRKWLEDESTLPSDAYQAIATVSLTMIQLTQLAYFEAALKQGWSIDDLMKHTKGSTGHSQGLISMTFCALGKSGKDYYNALAVFTKYILLLGAHAQKTFPYVEPTTEDLALAAELGLKDPAPMVAVLGVTHERIAELVEATNAGLPADKKIYMSLFNSPANRILSSHRSSLLNFYKQHKATLEAEQVKFVFLRTTCPFHSPLMEKAIAPFEADRQRIGFNFKGSELKVPVYSFASGNDYRQLDDLCSTMSYDLLVNTLYWEKSLSPLKELKPSHIVDFGPGKTSQRLTADVVSSFGLDTPILGLANAKELKSFTEA